MTVATGAPEAAAYDAIQDYAALNPTQTVDFIRGVATGGGRPYPPTGAGTLGAIAGKIIGAFLK